MRDTRNVRLVRLAAAAAARYGISGEDVVKLLACERALSRWAEAECNGEIERDEDTGKPFRFYNASLYTGEARRRFIPDREASTIRRIDRILAQYPGVRWYHQSDPRGCAVHLYREEELAGSVRFQGCGIDSCYSSVGLALCI